MVIQVSEYSGASCVLKVEKSRESSALLASCRSACTGISCVKKELTPEAASRSDKHGILQRYVKVIQK
jgi:hypothetical protein